MSALLGKAGKKLFEQHLESYAPADPLYEVYTDDRGRQKRRKRELPPGLSARDAAILRSVKRRAHYLDKGFHLCGMRFGWTFFISLIPIPKKADLPNWLVGRMMFNNAVSLAVSFVPFAGDVVMAVYKANSRNAALLEEFLRIRGEEYLKLHPEEVEVAGAKGKKSSSGGWFTRKKGKGDLSAKDAEQVKPGAGFKPGEMIEEVRIVPPESSQGRGQDAHTPPAQRSRKSSGGSSFTSFFSRSRRPSAADPVRQMSPGALQANRGSRFVENVSNSSAAPSTTALRD